MGLESTDEISGLNPSNPVSGDPVSQGDNHIRMIKEVLQNDAAALSEDNVFDGNLTAKSYEVTGNGAFDGMRGTINGTLYEIEFKDGDTTDPYISLRLNDAAAMRVYANTTAALDETQSGLEGITRNKGDARYAMQLAGNEYHDPAGVASWRVIGETMEVWGKLTPDANGTAIIIWPNNGFEAEPACTFGPARETSSGGRLTGAFIEGPSSDSNIGKTQMTCRSIWVASDTDGDNVGKIRYHAIGQKV